MISFEYVAINNSGAAAFRGFLGGTGSSDGVFRGSGGVLTQIGREGQSAPDGNGTFQAFPNPPAINDAGLVAFDAPLTGTSGFASDDDGIFVGTGLSTAQIARAAQPVPGGNGDFSNFDEVAINDLGMTMFAATLTNTSGGSSDNIGIYRGYGGALTQIAREGQAAPDGNGVFSDFNQPSLNNLGVGAFEGFLTGTAGGASDDQGIFRGFGGAVTQIAREGQLAPDGNGLLSNFGDPAINDSGVTAFAASLTGTSGGSAAADRAWLCESRRGPGDRHGAGAG